MRLRLPHFFIERPIFAAVISIIIVIVGIIAYPTLPVAQYPDVAPPTVTVAASYPGANAQTMAQVVSQPIEQAINGVEHMTYMSSGSTGDGRVAITITFDQGTDIDKATVLVQNRVSAIEPRLPAETRAIGVTVRKNSPDMLMIVKFNSPNGTLSRQYISNYLALQVVDRLARINGVGDVRILGGREYNMRIWIDPDLAAGRNLTVDEIISGIRRQNAQVAAGALGQPPFGARDEIGYQVAVQAQGRLTSPEEFGEIVLKRSSGGGLTRLRDVARLELGAQDYTQNGYSDGKPTVFLGISQLPGSNALSTADALMAELKAAEKDFPQGLAWGLSFNPTEHIRHSISAVNQTLAEALILVVLVVVLFLQSWRAAIIPIVAIPVSLIGAVAAMGAFGFSLNNLSLFGLLLAIGIVVDDAIVVVENIERLMEEEGMSPREAAHETMDEVAGAVIAIALVLFGVFVPTAYIPGISGEFYKQFALTIVSATAISAFVSLSLSPALAALLLKPRVRHGAVEGTSWRSRVVHYAHRFNDGFDNLSRRYSASTARTIRRLAPIGLIYLLLIGLAAWRFTATPTGFIPSQDESVLVAAIQLPPGSSLQRTDRVLQKWGALARQNPNMLRTSEAAGLDGTNFGVAPNYATMFMTLKPRHDRDQGAGAIAADLTKVAATVPGGRIIVIQPPAVRGLGISGGWKMMIQDRKGAGYEKLEEVTNRLIAEANQTKGIMAAFTGFNTKSPAVTADIDRSRAEQMGLGVEDVFATLGTYLGSTYVNDFNFLGRTYRVTAQADSAHRREKSDIGRLQARSSSGGMVPLASVVTLRDTTTPYRVVRYNLYPSAEVQGANAPGTSTGQGLEMMSGLAKRLLPQGFDYEWTEIAYEQVRAGNTGIFVFGLAVLFVFLLLAANYESLVLPLAVILIVPMCILATMVGVNLMRLDNNILTQIGMVVLIGLAAKNAILIVEFARQGEEQGLGVRAAVERAAHQRLRPIVMTSIAFIFGTLPLVIAKGAGFEMRQALGVAVCFGMIGVTGFGLIFTPAFYVMARKLGDRVRAWWRGEGVRA